MLLNEDQTDNAYFCLQIYIVIIFVFGGAGFIDIHLILQIV